MLDTFLSRGKKKKRMRANRQIETETGADARRRQECDHVSVSGVVIKAASNTQECRNVR